MKTRYHCPVHAAVILYVEDSDSRLMTFTLAEKPRECPQCQKAYYKWECSTDDNVDDES